MPLNHSHVFLENLLKCAARGKEILRAGHAVQFKALDNIKTHKLQHKVHSNMRSVYESVEVCIQLLPPK